MEAPEINPYALVGKLFAELDNKSRHYELTGVWPGEPIVAEEAIVDNALVIESTLQEFCAHLGLDSENTQTYALLQEVREGLQTFAHFSEDAAQLAEWLEADTLPVTFRRDFIQFVINKDDLIDIIANTSQARWERLRTWSSGRD